jgi:hypothetical protein
MSILIASIGELVEFAKWLTGSISELTPGGWVLIVTIVGFNGIWVYRTYHRIYDKSIAVRDGLIVAMEKNEGRLKGEKTELQNCLHQLGCTLSVMRVATGPGANQAVIQLESLVEVLLSIETVKILTEQLHRGLAKCILLFPPIFPLYGDVQSNVAKIHAVEQSLAEINLKTLIPVVHSHIYLSELHHDTSVVPTLHPAISGFDIGSILKNIKTISLEIDDLWKDSKTKEEFRCLDPTVFETSVAIFEKKQKSLAKSKDFIPLVVNQPEKD